jgi:hypothetical protein
MCISKIFHWALDSYPASCHLYRGTDSSADDHLSPPSTTIKTSWSFTSIPTIPLTYRCRYALLYIYMTNQTNNRYQDRRIFQYVRWCSVYSVNVFIGPSTKNDARTPDVSSNAFDRFTKNSILLDRASWLKILMCGFEESSLNLVSDIDYTGVSCSSFRCFQTSTGRVSEPLPYTS